MSLDLQVALVTGSKPGHETGNGNARLNMLNLAKSEVLQQH